MTVLEHIGAATKRLVRAGLTSDLAAVDAEVLARHVLRWNQATYLSNRTEKAPINFNQHYELVLCRRERREPVSLITGYKEFWNLEFEVTSDVLTPRPETEILIEEVLALINDPLTTTVSIVDVGTGSGCIVVTLACQLPMAKLTATDISESAIAIAQRNAERHGVINRISWIRSPLLDGITDQQNLIVANLPYIPASKVSHLLPEIREFEPLIALVGGEDGLDIIRGLIAAARQRLVLGGHLIIEFGEEQSEKILTLVSTQPGLSVVCIRKDLQGIPRAAIIRRTEPGSYSNH